MMSVKTNVKSSVTAIVLAAGQGKRMGTKIQKQYLELAGRPVIYYTLHTFETSDIIDRMILVTQEGQEEYCRKEIVERYHFEKVCAVVAGGAERYASVWNGLEEMKRRGHEDGYVFIHDGARPFVTHAILERIYESVQREKACAAGMPVKDTIKIADNAQYAVDTPERKNVWMVQTPQAFSFPLIYSAYQTLMQSKEIKVTDDAMVLEQTTGHAVKLVEGAYDNIKITTPEDLEIAEVFAAREQKSQS